MKCSQNLFLPAGRKALLLAASSIILCLSACNSDYNDGTMDNENGTMTDTTLDYQTQPTTPPPPIDSMSADTLDGRPM